MSSDVSVNFNFPTADVGNMEVLPKPAAKKC
jgi:hypothetical protein